MLVVWPVALIARHTFAGGIGSLERALSDPVLTHALWLTVQVAFTAVLLNTIFGVAISLLLVRYTFPGRRVLSAHQPAAVGLPGRGRSSPGAGLRGVDGWFGGGAGARGDR
jgi:sulfate transport system permease protein